MQQTDSHPERLQAALRLAPDQLPKLVRNLAVVPHWLDGRRFWYSRDTEPSGSAKAAGSAKVAGEADAAFGKEFILVDADTGERAPAFDHARLAAALARRRVSADPARLPFTSFEFTEGGQAITFTVGHRRWRCALDSYECKRDMAGAAARLQETVSPDGRYAAFVRGHNVWVRSLEHGSLRQLTFDGRTDDDYASRPDFYGAKTLDEVQGRRTQPALVWSPDSTRIVTHRLNQRGVRRLPVMQYVPRGGRDVAPAKMRTVHYPLPGDAVLPTVTHLVLGVDGSRVDIQLGPMEVYNTDALLSPNWHNLWWDESGEALYFIRPTRGCKSMQLWMVDAHTGAAKRVYEESGDRFYDLDMRWKNSLLPDVRVLRKSGAFIWASQQDGWYHLYLRDLSDGSLRKALTRGDWTVRELLAVDELGGFVYFLGAGREAGRDPYLRHLYRVRLDGSDLQLLTPEDADHEVSLSPDLGSFVDTYSRVDQPPVSVLRRTDGSLVTELEEADVTALFAAGYQTPLPFCVKAADGETDVYGIVIPPAGVQSGDKVPLVEYEYGGPQTAITPKRFTVGRESDAAAYGQVLAQLGFATLIMDGRGTPGRSKAFHDAKSLLGDAAGLVDHVAALKQLPARFGFMDPQRVGIYGFSGGGYGSARAIMTWPDVYKVAVSCCGDHDNRLYDTTWWDRYMGDWSRVTGSRQGTPTAAAADTDVAAGTGGATASTGATGGVAGDAAKPAAAAAGRGEEGRFASAEPVLDGDGAERGTSGIGQGQAGPNDAGIRPYTEAPAQDNQSLVENLRGKLLLMHGDIDDNVHPALTMRLVDALIRADKDFDMLLLPNRGHALRRDPYVMRRTVEYFVRNL